MRRAKGDAMASPFAFVLHSLQAARSADRQDLPRWASATVTLRWRACRSVRGIDPGETGVTGPRGGASCLCMLANSKRLLSRTLKISAATLSMAAALVSVLNFAQSYEEAAAAQARIAEGGVKWIGVTPASDTANAIGDTIHLAATVT